MATNSISVVKVAARQDRARSQGIPAGSPGGGEMGGTASRTCLNIGVQSGCRYGPIAETNRPFPINDRNPRRERSGNGWEFPATASGVSNLYDDACASAISGQVIRLGPRVVLARESLPEDARSPSGGRGPDMARGRLRVRIIGNIRLRTPDIQEPFCYRSWSENVRTIICACRIWQLAAAHRWSGGFGSGRSARAPCPSKSQSIPLPAAISVTVGEQSEEPETPQTASRAGAIVSVIFPTFLQPAPQMVIENGGDTVIYQLGAMIVLYRLADDDLLWRGLHDRDQDNRRISSASARWFAPTISQLWHRSRKCQMVLGPEGIGRAAPVIGILNTGLR